MLYGGGVMLNVVGVSLELLKDVCYFSPQDLKLKKGQAVLVETENGLQLGTTVTDVYQEKKENLVLPLKKVLHIATDLELEKYRNLQKEADDALQVARGYAKELGLDMTFVDAHYTFEKNQLFFSFVAENRIDFRELTKKLAQKYKTRIELRQIGVRDKAKKIGGLGPCGLFLCCNTFLTDFNSVSINMAKNQMLALNPSKINGVCGRLLCCLGYENETYSSLKQGLPQVGMIVKNEDGSGKVISVDIFKRTYKVDFGAKGIIEYDEQK